MDILEIDANFAVMSFGAYASNQSDWNFRKWLVPMLIVSLLFHACLMAVFTTKRLHNFVPVQRERLIPRPFNIKRSEIDSRILQNTQLPSLENANVKPVPDIAKLASPDPKRSFEKLQNEIRSTPAAADLSEPLLNEKPKVDPSAVNAAMTQMEERSSHVLERELEQIRKELTTTKPSSLNQPALTAEGLVDSTSDPVISTSEIASKLKGESAGPEIGGTGFSNLDQLLSQTGPLPSNTGPVGLKGDTLFSYDSFILTDQAVVSMTKLGRLIEKYPQANFIIEGHTDSFGTPDYNQQLSVARAESVKAWLVQRMAVDPARVQTRGFGSSKLLVPANKTVEEQQLNRRVEIVIRPK